MTRLARAIALAIVVAVVGGCSRADVSGARLTVFAAASLRDALDAAIDAYARIHPAVSIEVSVDSSTALRVQIEQGAPADVFLSADLENATRLAADGLATGPSVAFAANSVAIAVPQTNPGGIESPFDIAEPGVAVVAANPDVPISGYATRLIERLAALPDAPAGLEHGYRANIVSREANVGAIAAKLALGEADAGIVYRTDITGSGGLREVSLPAGVGVSARYGAVVLSRSPHPAEASAFLAWLTGPDGEAVLGRFGFVAP